MADQEIRVRITLDQTEVKNQFAGAQGAVSGETKKMAQAVEVSTGQIVGRFTHAASSARMLGSTIAGGDVTGAIVSFGMIAGNTVKAFSLQMAAATVGLTFVIGALALFIKKQREESALLKQLNEDIKNGQQALSDFLVQTIVNEQERNKAIRKKEFTERSDTLKKQYDLEAKLLDKQLEGEKITRAQFLSATDQLDAKYQDLSLRNRTKFNADIAAIDAEKTKGGKDKQEEKKIEMMAAWLGKEVQVHVEANEAIAETDRNLTAQQAENERIFEELQAAAAVRVAEYWRQKNNAGKQALRDTVQNLAYLSTQIKEFKGIFKAAAITETLIDTYVGAQGIFKNIASAPFLGPFALPMAIAGAGVATLAGLARVNEIRKFGMGGQFVTNGPQMIMVGDNPGGREAVSVTPLSSTNYYGAGSGPTISLGNIYISGNADAGTVSALHRSREAQLRQLRKDLQELSYSRQMPALA